MIISWSPHTHNFKRKKKEKKRTSKAKVVLVYQKIIRQKDQDQRLKSRTDNRNKEEMFYFILSNLHYFYFVCKYSILLDFYILLFYNTFIGLFISFLYQLIFYTIYSYDYNFQLRNTKAFSTSS